MERSSLWDEPDYKSLSSLSEVEYRELKWLKMQEISCDECKRLTTYNTVEDDYYCKSCDLFVGFEIGRLILEDVYEIT